MKKIISLIKRTLKPVVAVAKPTRLIVSVAKWKDDADSPVMLMVDDLTNAFCKTSGDMPAACGDWGGLHYHPNSIMTYLDKKLFQDFSEVKTTFFTVMGEISRYNHQQAFSSAKTADHDDESISFFRNLGTDPRFEIAYHGFNHGLPGETTDKFIQEWDGFPSTQKACEQIQKGIEIYRKIFVCPPQGGKYGGWKYNQFADDSIDLSGFRWWCRDWMSKDCSGDIHSDYYEPQYFGKNRVVALPSTVHGFHWSKGQIRRLLSDRQIISIEEHMGALRPDKDIQTPNVFDDVSSLRKLFTFLRNKNVWYAKASEIAAYFDTRSRSHLSDISTDSFRLNYDGSSPENSISIIIQSISPSNSSIEEMLVTTPSGKRVKGKQHSLPNSFLFNIAPVTGTYKVRTT